MGRLLKLEFKRIFKMKITIIALIIAVVLAILGGLINVIGIQYSTVNEKGEIVKLTGFSALQEKKSKEKEIVLTEENLLKIYDNYKEVWYKYNGKIPDEIYAKEVSPYRDIISIFPQIDNNDKSGIDYSKFITSSTLKENISHFYDRWKDLARDYAKTHHNEDSGAYKVISNNIEKIHTPFTYKSFNGWDNQVLSLDKGILIILLLCCIISAQIFSSNYNNKTDNIYRTTKHGRKTLAISKIIAMTSVNAFIYIINIAIYTIVNLAIYGTDGWNVNIQFLYIYSSAPFTLQEIYLMLILFGLISVCAITAINMFLSSITTSSIFTIVGSLIILIVPWILNSMGNIPQFLHFILDVLPSNILNLSNSIMKGLDYFSLNQSTAIWEPWLLVIGSIICFILFNTLAVIAYSKHQAKR